MRNFQSIEDIRNASLEELSKVPEIPESTAQQIYDYFHQETTSDQAGSEAREESENI
jgi:ERCC4-type nuclease